MGNDDLCYLENCGFLSRIVCCFIVAITVIVIVLIVILYLKTKHKQEIEVEKTIIQVGNEKSIDVLLSEIRKDLKRICDTLAEIKSGEHRSL